MGFANIIKGLSRVLVGYRWVICCSSCLCVCLCVCLSVSTSYCLFCCLSICLCVCVYGTLYCLGNIDANVSVC